MSTPLSPDPNETIGENFKVDDARMHWLLYYKIRSEADYLLMVLYVPVIALALAANVLVITVVYKYQNMRSVINYFVVNLSVADLLVTTICMPVAMSQAVSIVWDHGEVMCKVSSYLQGVAVAASVFTITAMSIDRYLAISSPIRRVFNRNSTVLVIIALWLVALIIFAPLLSATSLRNPSTEFNNITVNRSWTGTWNMSENWIGLPQNFSRVSRLPPAFYICSENFDTPLFSTVCFILVYAIPGFAVVISYTMMGRTLCAHKPPFDCDSVQGSASSQQSCRLVRERRRIAWILLLLAVLFAVCWLPFNVLRLLLDLGAVKVKVHTLSYCLFLGHANSALNPMIYCFMTRNFRRRSADILCPSLRRKHRHRGVQRAAVIDHVCAGCSAGGTVRQRLLMKRRMLPGCGCGLPIGVRHTLRRTGTTSSGSYYRHTLRSLRGRQQEIAEQNVDDKADKKQGSARNLKNESSQPRANTLVTTDEKRCDRTNDLTQTEI